MFLALGSKTISPVTPRKRSRPYSASRMRRAIQARAADGVQQDAHAVVAQRRKRVRWLFKALLKARLKPVHTGSSRVGS